jgi:multicomponent Na+:H+ antiporter subunit C
MITASAVMLIGLYGLIAGKNLIRVLLSLNVLFLGLNFLLAVLSIPEDGMVSFGEGLPVISDPFLRYVAIIATIFGFCIIVAGIVIAIIYYKTHHTLEVHNFANAFSKPDDEEVVE